MTLSKQRVAELITQVDPGEVASDVLGAITDMSECDWAKFSRFLDLIQEEAITGRGSWVRREDLEHQVRCLDEALNPTQSRSVLAKDPDLIDVVAQAIPVIQAGRVDTREQNLLRRVYEEARAYLRFNGIDPHRAGLVFDRMDDAIEKVKVFDSGTEGA